MANALFNVGRAKFMDVGDEYNLERLALLLGVDELQANRASLGGITVRARLGDQWMATTIELNQIYAAGSATAKIADTLSELASALKQSMLTIDTASGEALDKIAENYGVTRTPEQPRPQNRFEAVVEELKKL